MEKQQNHVENSTQTHSCTCKDIAICSLVDDITIGHIVAEDVERILKVVHCRFGTNNWGKGRKQKLFWHCCELTCQIISVSFKQLLLIHYSPPYKCWDYISVGLLDIFGARKSMIIGDVNKSGWILSQQMLADMQRLHTGNIKKAAQPNSGLM